MKILVAEDDLMTSKAIEKKLKNDGYEIVIAPDGKIALELLKNQFFDAILVDIHMPYNSGLEIIAYLRNELNNTCPVAVVSRVGLTETVQQAFELGADDYITKPFDPDELSAKVKSLIENS